MKLFSSAVCLSLLLPLLSGGCGSDSGKNSRSSSLFPDYGLKGGDVIIIQISSPDLSNSWSGDTGISEEDTGSGNTGGGDTGGTGDTSGDNGTGTPGFQKTMVMDAGTTSRLSIVAYDINGVSYTDIKVEWSSSDSDIATVNKNTGEVTGVSPGDAIITAKLKMPDGTALTDTVLITVLPSPVNGKGWSAADVSLPRPMWDHASAIWNKYIYVAGGHSGCFGDSQDCGFTNRVSYAPVNPDGSIGSFSETTPLPKYLRGHAMVAYNNYLYIIGGIEHPEFIEPPYPNPENFQTLLNEKVYYGRINPEEGSIGTWNETKSLPSPDPDDETLTPDKAGLFAPSAAVHTVNGTGYIYLTGGWSAELERNIPNLLIGPINNEDGNITNWIRNSGSDLPYDLSKHASVAASVNGQNYLYIIGGNSGAIGAMGGTQTFHREICFAKISDDGIPYEWKLASNTLIAPLIDHTSVASGRYIFVLGGRNADDNWPNRKIYSNVYYFFIDGNGDLELARAYPDMPVPLFHHAAVADKNTVDDSINIYVTGGATGDTEEQENRKDTVYYLNQSP